jgi:hypothetical protein
MKYGLLPLLLAGAMHSSMAWAAPGAWMLSLHLPQGQHTLAMPQPMRLAEALQSVDTTHTDPLQDYDSRSVFLARAADQAAFVQRRLMLESELAALPDDCGASAVLTKVRQHTLGARRLWETDRIQLALFPHLNRWIDQSMHVQVRVRPSQIWLMGAAPAPVSLPVVAGGTLRDYLDQHRISARSGVVAVIQPDGRWQWVPAGYWNAVPHAVAPGATLWLPLPSRCAGDPDDHTSLNTRVAALLAESVPE